MLNAVLQKQITEIETKLLDTIRQGEIDQDQLSLLAKKDKLVRSTGKVSEFVTELRSALKGKVSEGRVKHYEMMGNKLEAYDHKLRIRDISLSRLNDLESYLRKTHCSQGIDQNYCPAKFRPAKPKPG